MKKAILFALILVVSVACVFSSISVERHSVRLKTIIDSNTPAFQFEFTNGKANPNAVVVANADADEFDPDKDYNEFGTEATAVEVANIAKEDLDLLFTVKLANKAKCNEIYTLRFQAGPFAVTRNGEPGTLDPDANPVVEASSDINFRLGVKATDVSETGLKLRFNGTNCTEGSLATYRVHYTADDSIDDNKEDEYYYADISLIITSDN